MIRAMYTAASGMSAQQLNLDTIANNLANSSTTGFRQLRLQFEEEPIWFRLQCTVDERREKTG